MLAKEPRERFAVPAEVAEAMAEFADAEELAEVLAAIPAEAWTRRGQPQSAKPRGGHGQAARSRIGRLQRRRRSQSRRMARQRFRRNVQLGVFASLLAVICGLLVWVATRPGGMPAGDPHDFQRRRAVDGAAPR